MLAILALSGCVVLRNPVTLNVFAAASLKEAFTSLARRYEQTHSDAKVRLNFAGSQTLAVQIENGAPADVFASAADKNLRQIRFDAGSYRVFAENALTIAVRKGYRGVRSFRDLDRAPSLVVAAPQVPVGAYTQECFQKASVKFGSAWLGRVNGHIVSREIDVKAVLAKIALGEADAGIVYASDVATSAGKVTGISIPRTFNVIAKYPIAIPIHAGNKVAARQFIDLVTSTAGQAILRRNGFTAAQ